MFLAGNALLIEDECTILTIHVQGLKSYLSWISTIIESKIWGSHQSGSFPLQSSRYDLWI